ncbi:MAG: DUF3450 family protein [Marinicellaceae bacterium]
MRQKIQLCLLLTCFSFAIFNVSAQEDNNLANNLIQLRGEVEDLQSELKILKSEHKNSLAYLSTRKTELQANVDRKNLKIKQTTIELQKLQDKVKLLGEGSEQLIPQVEQLLIAVKESIQSGIPFKYLERLDVIEEIERKLTAKQITSQNAINRLWAFIEDEIRLTRENAIYSQTIELNGESLLVEVAKLGTVLMYFKTKDDQYGTVNRENNQWSYNLLTDTQQSQQVAVLFDSLRKQIRQGYFKLPLNITLTSRNQ